LTCTTSTGLIPPPYRRNSRSHGRAGSARESPLPGSRKLLRQPFAVLKPSIPFPRFRPSIPWSREPEAEILPIWELDWLLPHSPLGRGFLTGKIRSMDDLLKGTIGPAAIRAFRQRIYSRIWNSCSRLKKWQPRRGQTWTASAGWVWPREKT